MVDFQIILHNSISDEEVVELSNSASEHGINDFTVTPSRRIITAETEREDAALTWVVGWLSEALFAVEDIAYIEEKRIYWPEFVEAEEPLFEVDLFDRDD